MGFRNSWRGDARPRAVRWVKPSHTCCYSYHTVSGVFQYDIFMYEVYVTSSIRRSPYEYEYECLIDIHWCIAFSYFSSHVPCLCSYRQGWIGTLSFFTPNPDSSTMTSWITRFVWPVICCCPPKPGKAQSDRKLNGTFRHSGDVSALCTLYSIHVRSSYSCLFLSRRCICNWIHTEFHLGRPVSGPRKAHCGWTILPVDSRIFFATPHRWVVRYCHYHTCILWGSDLHDNDKSRSIQYCILRTLYTPWRNSCRDIMPIPVNRWPPRLVLDPRIRYKPALKRHGMHLDLHATAGLEGQVWYDNEEIPVHDKVAGTARHKSLHPFQLPSIMTVEDSMYMHAPTTHTVS